MHTVPTTLKALACSTLLCLQSLGLAWAQTPSPTPAPPATNQPAYPSASAPPRRVNPQTPSRLKGADEARCMNLKGLKKSECERRDNPADEAPAGVTPAMRDKQRAADKEQETPPTATAARPQPAEDATPASDTAKAKPSPYATQQSNPSSPPTPGNRAQDIDKTKSTADDADTLGRPRG